MIFQDSSLYHPSDPTEIVQRHFEIVAENLRNIGDKRMTTISSAANILLPATSSVV